MIRPYQTNDKSALLRLLKLNIPKYFHPDEYQEFSHYLDHEVEDYFVFVDNGNILGAGGINYGFNQGTTARISWDLVHPNHQGVGIGTSLVSLRVEQIRQYPDVKTIEVRTTQMVYPFYQKFGFKLIQQEKDFWAPGYDLYRMEINI